jgi:D-glycero-alpha-D-manno-heptose-7-phosphate kinase
MKTLILAGGFGTRLKDVIKDVPKPMALIAGKPFLEHQIRYLKKEGLEDIVLCVHYMANTIKSYFGNGGKFGVELTYSEEDTPLGTAGAIKKAEKYIQDTFFVLNGDSFSKINLKEFLEFHKSKRSIASMSITSSEDPSHYGNILTEGSRIIDFSEKINEKSALINSGVYIFEPKIFDYIESEKKVSLEKEIFPKLAKESKLYGFNYEGYFIDIGRPETYYQFRKEALEDLIARPEISLREAMQKMTEKGTEVLLIINSDKKLLGALNDKIIKSYLIDGGNIDQKVSDAMIKDLAQIGKITDSEEDLFNLLLSSGTKHLPIIDNEGKLIDIKFRIEEIKTDGFPVVRGKTPLRISFAGGGTDLPYFFEKYGGVVINSTINKYCHATAIKRADSKIIINSDLKKEETVFDLKKIDYNGNFDLIKSIVKIMKPEFGFDLYLNNDVPPGRGLGSSASLAVLITKLIRQLQGMDPNDSEIANIAYRAEIDELKIKGGWQDQYAAVTGGFNFMEFTKDKTIIYPLKLKDSTINELREHLTLCYVGNTHFSGSQHESQKKSFSDNEEAVTKRLNKMKEIAIEIKDSLLTNNISRIGELLHESWKNKKEINSKVSNPLIDELYDLGIKNGAYGGKLLGSGGGGYLLFYHPPEKRNNLSRILKNQGKEILDFDFESRGAEVWTQKR